MGKKKSSGIFKKLNKKIKYRGRYGDTLQAAAQAWDFSLGHGDGKDSVIHYCPRILRTAMSFYTDFLR